MSTALQLPPGVLSSGAEAVASPERELVYASFWRRVAAQAIDFCGGAALSTVVAVPLIWLVESLHDAFGVPEFKARLIAGVLVFFEWLLVGLILEAQATASRSGATLGKRLLKVRVVCDDGSPVSASQAVARHSAKFLSAFALMVGFVICCFNRRHQCLHDLAAGTIVVRS
ncbi:MAG TPA: RDD family protein [Candidatus Acidoferrales bacterium]|nr:RDD family protein [Candidatus Acidoferrales bacterium]